MSKYRIVAEVESDVAPQMGCVVSPASERFEGVITAVTPIMTAAECIAEIRQKVPLGYLPSDRVANDIYKAVQRILDSYFTESAGR